MDLWRRYAEAIRDEPLPLALVDLAAFDANVATLARIAREHGKPLRVATKSIRSLALLQRVFEKSHGAARGVMTYTASETGFLANEGFGDLLLAYPTAQRADATLLATANARGALARVVVDDKAQLEVLDRAAREARTKIPVVIDVDVSYRPFSRVHIGVRRSPLFSAEDVVGFAREIARFGHLELGGLMGYEAQIAGVPDRGGPLAAATRGMKRLSRREVAARRSDIARAMEKAGFPVRLFNGGGTGSLASSAKESAVTEVTAGSGFLDSHLFDDYEALSLVPAAFFALQVVRTPAPGFVTCHGGGYVASGAAGKDRLPIPALPAGLSLTALEGAGEVQTPLVVDTGVRLAIGDPVFFRHAKAGELAEHFDAYALVEGSKITGRAKTYRGLGHSFLG